MPNFEAVASVMISNVPSAPFSMALIPPLGTTNPQLMDALKKLSFAKYGRPRAQVEQEIFKRLRAGDEEREARKTSVEPVSQSSTASSKQSGSFLDEWLAKRKQQLKPQAQTQEVSSGLQHNEVVIPQQQVAPVSEVKPTTIAPGVGATTAPAKVVAQPVHVAPQTNGAKILNDLQRTGVGDNITFGHKELPTTEHALTGSDNRAVESAIHKTQASDVMQQPTTQTSGNELKLTRSEGEQEAPEYDEIFIDVRGRLHHRDEQ